MTSLPGLGHFSFFQWVSEDLTAHPCWGLQVLLCDLGLDQVDPGQGGEQGLERESRLLSGPRQLCWQRHRATRDARPALAASPASFDV